MSHFDVETQRAAKTQSPPASGYPKLHTGRNMISWQGTARSMVVERDDEEMTAPQDRQPKLQS